MGTTDRRASRGRRWAASASSRAGTELREARLSAGLSQRRLAEAAGLSQSTVARVELGAASSMSVEQLSVLFSLVGHRLSVRAYPEGPPLRDVGHARLLARFGARLPAEVRMRLEVRVGSGDDQRSWDAMIDGPGWDCPIEAETAIRDLQATERRIALKANDAGADHVLLVMSETRRHRRILSEFGHLLEARYPISGRAAMAAIRSGRCPGASAIILV